MEISGGSHSQSQYSSGAAAKSINHPGLEAGRNLLDWVTRDLTISVAATTAHYAVAR